MGPPVWTACWGSVQCLTLAWSLFPGVGTLVQVPIRNRFDPAVPVPLKMLS